MKKTTAFLFVIILLGVFLRLYQINSNPKAIYGDGLTAVYDAYSILKTGHDQKGEFLPLVFSLGGGRPGGYVYATIPFVALLDPTALAANMVSILSGIGIILLLFLLGKHFFSTEVGLSISAIAAFNPWELSLSRGPFESHFALFLTLLGLYALILGFRKKYWLIVFGLAFGLASQTYSTYRLTIPLLTVFLLVWVKKADLLNYTKKPLFIISLLIIFASTLLGIYLTLSRGNQDRFGTINIFKDTVLGLSISQKLNSERSLDSLPPSISKIFHTKQIELTGILGENYLGNFLPGFLFLHGDGQVRHNPAELGEFYFVDALFLLLGLIYLYKFKRHLLILLMGWILIAPLATSLVGGPHALRSSLLLPPLLIIMGLGLWQIWSLRKKTPYRLVLILLATVFFFQFIFFVDRLYFVAPQKNSASWSYPAKEASLLALQNIQKFDFVILSNDIDNMEFAYPVYAKLDPNLVIEQNKTQTKIGEFSFFRYGNVYIGSLPNTRVMQFLKDLPGSVLYIGAGKEQAFLENYTIVRGFDSLPDLAITSLRAPFSN